MNRRILYMAALAGTLALAANTTWAQEVSISGRYAVAISEVANNCAHPGFAETSGQVVIDQTKNAVRLNLSKLPSMTGSVVKGGKLKAKVKDKQAADGLRRELSTSGRAADGRLTLVLVVEYYRENKPICSQSFTVTGKRAP